MVAYLQHFQHERSKISRFAYFLDTVCISLRQENVRATQKQAAEIFRNDEHIMWECSVLGMEPL